MCGWHLSSHASRSLNPKAVNPPGGVRSQASSRSSLPRRPVSPPRYSRVPVSSQQPYRPQARGEDKRYGPLLQVWPSEGWHCDDVMMSLPLTLLPVLQEWTSTTTTHCIMT